MKIGELAQRTGCLVETIRYYERVGLLAPPDRGTNNYRSYEQVHAERLGFIRHCRALDMTLYEIRKLLELRDFPEQNCAEVNAMLDRHITEVKKRITALSVLESQLGRLRSRCNATDLTRECAILTALSNA